MVRPGGPALAVPPPVLEGGRPDLQGRPPAGVPLGPGPPPGPPRRAAAPRPWIDAPQRRVLLVEGWDDEAEGSGSHWVGITDGGSVRCLLRGVMPLARDPRAAAAALMASTRRLCAVWYAVLPAPGATQPPLQHPWGGTTPTLGRGSRSVSSWQRGGSAAGCGSCSRRSDPGVRSLGSPAGEAAEALPPHLPPSPPRVSPAPIPATPRGCAPRENGRVR